MTISIESGFFQAVERNHSQLLCFEAGLKQKLLSSEKRNHDYSYLVSKGELKNDAWKL